MPHPDHKSLPLDQQSTDRLAADGLDLRFVDTTDDASYTKWYFAENRGFLGAIGTEVDEARSRAGVAYRRTSGVYDAKTPDPDVPVATIASWVGELTVPGGASIPSWAISGVTVSPTHAGRGIARAMLESELRTAADAGLPMAMLTVSESALYGRYGFGMAVTATNWTIETKRVNWIGPTPAGRVDYVSVEDWRASVAHLHDRIRPTRPGEIDVWSHRWDQVAGLAAKDGDEAKKKRAVRYTDESGELRGLLLYSVSDDSDDDFTKHKLWIGDIRAETPDAYAALWRFALHHPLVGEVKAWLQSSDEPIWWMIDDHRAAHIQVTDHQYLRVLDVPAALGAREYPNGGTLALEVVDPLGLASGAFLLDGGAATAVDSIPDGVPALRLGVTELGAIYLGGVRASSLAGAGRITELTPGAAAVADAVFASATLPYLSVWY